MLQLVNCIACDALRIQNIFKDSFGIKGGRQEWKKQWLFYDILIGLSVS